MKVKSVFKTIIYCLLFIFGFFIAIGAAVMRDAHDICPLYYDSPSNPGSQSNCNYPLAIAVIYQLFYALFRIVLLVLLLSGKLENSVCCFSDAMELVYFVVDMVALLLTFVGACILTAGHVYTRDNNYGGDWVVPSKIAQAGAWISTALWALLVLVGFIFMWRGGKLPCGNRSAASENRPA